MGLEVLAHVKIGHEHGEARVHLDIQQLQIGGSLRAKIGGISGVFQCQGTLQVHAQPCRNLFC